MKTNFKSASIVQFSACLILLVITSCDQMQYEPPHVFGGSEVPDETLNQPRLVTTPTADAMANLTWPRLGDVPAKPTNFTPQPILNQSVREMETNRDEGRHFKDEVDNPLPVVVPQSTSQR
jgi:hypothetical protein